MTVPQKRALTIALLTTVIGAIAAPVLGAAWKAKVDTSVFEMHVEQDMRHRALDSALAKEQKELTLDILCSLKPDDRRCR
jgi:hypothetical protein